MLKACIGGITTFFVAVMVLVGLGVLWNGVNSERFVQEVYAASGQFSMSPSSGTFYVGRQFEVQINITTDEATTAADFIITYDDTKLEVQDMMSGVAGVQIQPGNMYPSYPSNSNDASGGEIILTGFTSEPSGVLQGGGTGWFGTIRFLVIDTDASGSDVEFEFTGVGETTDSNISDVDGIDMLDGVTDGTFTLLEDTISPYLSDWNPTHSEVGVGVSSNVQFRINDDESGVDITTVTATVDGILYGYGDSGFSYSCTTSNYDVVPHCDVTINPASNFPYDYDVSVALYAEDLAADPGTPPIPDHNSVTDSYSFHTEFDLNAPYTTNHSPPRFSSGAATGTNISFHLRDNETGVHIQSVVVTVDGIAYTYSGANTFAYSGSVHDYTITVNPGYEFEQNETIFVQVDARDMATQWGVAAYNWLHENYWFVTSDTLVPWVDRRVPDSGAIAGIGLFDPVTFHINDTGVGVDISTVTVIVNGTAYQSSGASTFSYSGDSSDYYISIPAPAAGWGYDNPIAVGINGCDFSNNCMQTDVYAFAVLSYTCEVCEVCEECEVCEDMEAVIDEILSLPETSEISEVIQTIIDAKEERTRDELNEGLDNVAIMEVNNFEFTGHVRIVGADMI